VCARGAHGALLRGPSTSPLGAMDADHFAKRASRAFEVVVGLAATLIGAALLASAALVAYATSWRPTDVGVVVLLTVTLAVGLSLLVAGIRLVTGKHRSDGGLFSPWILRFGALIFLAAPVLALFFNRSWTMIIEAGVSLSAAVACFTLANRREQAAAERGAPNNRWSGP
jgi:hypothetical protein